MRGTGGGRGRATGRGAAKFRRGAGKGLADSGDAQQGCRRPSTPSASNEMPCDKNRKTTNRPLYHQVIDRAPSAPSDALSTPTRKQNAVMWGEPREHAREHASAGCGARRERGGGGSTSRRRQHKHTPASCSGTASSTRCAARVCEEAKLETKLNSRLKQEQHSSAASYASSARRRQGQSRRAELQQTQMHGTETTHPARGGS